MKKFLITFFLVVAVLGIGGFIALRTLPLDPPVSEPAPMRDGKGYYVLSGPEGDEGRITRVWYYKPAGVGREAPVVFVMHGMRRNPVRYLEGWMDAADKHNLVVIAPDFSRKHWGYLPHGYNLGNVKTWWGRINDESKWSFSTIERIFDYVRRANGLAQDRYFIFGHSAGGQFVHRLVLFQPDSRIKMAICANAGWYTFPEIETEFPYGLGGVSYEESRLGKSFEKNLVILLGDKDNDPGSPGLRKTKEANEQGAHRLERGRNFYDTARKKCEAAGKNFNWGLEFVEGVGHDNWEMSRAAAEIVAGYLEAEKQTTTRATSP